MSADWAHEQGNHGYRRYNYNAGRFTLSGEPHSPNIELYKTDNRSSYNALLCTCRGTCRGVQRDGELHTRYGETWGCVLGELFDYVNGVCDPLKAFGPGDYGPSGEDVRHRFVLAGSCTCPAGSS